MTYEAYRQRDLEIMAIIARHTPGNAHKNRMTYWEAWGRWLAGER